MELNDFTNIVRASSYCDVGGRNNHHNIRNSSILFPCDQYLRNNETPSASLETRAPIYICSLWRQKPVRKPGLPLQKQGNQRRSLYKLALEMKATRREILVIGSSASLPKLFLFAMAYAPLRSMSVNQTGRFYRNELGNHRC